LKFPEKKKTLNLKEKKNHAQQPQSRRERHGKITKIHIVHTYSYPHAYGPKSQLGRQTFDFEEKSHDMTG